VRRFDGHSRLRPFAHLAAAAAHERIIDMGPGAGAEGGKVVFEGAPRELLKASKSLTGKHLAARLG
jgi:excinuclease UvrABC ATPase subunit